MLTHQQIQESMRGVQDWVAQQQTPQTTQTTTKQEQITDIKKKADEIGSRISALKEKVGGSSQIQATDIKPPVGYEPPEPQKTSIMDSYTQSIAGTLEQQRKAIEQEIAKQREDINRKQAEAQAKFDQFTKQMEQTMEKDVQPLLQPFREDLEKAERERLFVEENFKENQQLVGELGTLLTDIQADVQRQKEVTGLSSIRQPRIQKATEEAMARVGVIEAVMSARNNQISTAFTMIDRSINAINADRQDQLSYYESLLNFYNKQRDEEGNRILNLEKDEKDMINAQMSLLESDYNRSLENAEYIKQLMMDPGTAQIIARAGVTLNDTPESTNIKMAEDSLRQERINMDNQMAAQGYKMITPAMVAGKPENQIERRIDPSGQERIYWNPTPTTDKYDEILSPAEADRLGVPYGTTKREAFGATTQGSGLSAVFYNEETGEEMGPWDAAQAIIDANPFARENELVNAIRQSVIDGKGKSILDTGDVQRLVRDGRVDLEIEDIAKSWVSDFFDAKLLQTRTEELLIAKRKAVADINQTSEGSVVQIGGKDVRMSEGVKQGLIDAIMNIPEDRATAKEIKALK